MKRIVATEVALIEHLDRLIDTDERRRTRRRMGYATISIALAGSVLVFVLGHWNFVLFLGFVMAMGWVYATSVERSPEEVEELVLVRTLLDRIDVDAKAPLTLEVAPRDVGPWLTLGFLAPSGVRVTLVVTARADDHLAVVELDDHGRPREYGDDPPGCWVASEDGFVLADPDAEDLEQLVGSI